ncbi:DnaJ protein, putative [Plasmodium relictum]|uniref:DnaJ protein, putative n=1 Tax=Plasmodium relictum TaxID=85471 RepID=A0A1J1H955_PLARL|nr:DnaJ protein, putative [Plasmodium relictum]CRH00133.1 DnaJ protein, putative [Plasmodium relictum]
MDKYEINRKLKMDFSLMKNKKIHVNSILLNNDIKCKNDLKKFSIHYVDSKNISDKKNREKEENLKEISDTNKNDLSNVQIKKKSTIKDNLLNNNLKNYCLKYNKIKENISVNSQESNHNLNSTSSIITNFITKKINNNKLNKEIEISINEKSEKQINEELKNNFETNEKDINKNKVRDGIENRACSENKEKMFNAHKDINRNDFSLHFLKNTLNENNKRDHKKIQNFYIEENNLEKKKKIKILHINEQNNCESLGKSENKIFHSNEKFEKKVNSLIQSDEIKSKEFFNSLDKDRERSFCNQKENDFYYEKEDNKDDKNIFENYKYEKMNNTSISSVKCKQVYKSLFSPVKYKELKKNINVLEHFKNVLNEICEHNKNGSNSKKVNNLKSINEISDKENKNGICTSFKCNQNNQKKNQSNYYLINSNKKNKEGINTFINNKEEDKIYIEDNINAKKNEVSVNISLHTNMNNKNLNDNLEKNKYTKKTSYNSILKNNFNFMFNKMDNYSNDRDNDETIIHDAKNGLNNNLKCYIKQYSYNDSNKNEDTNSDENLTNNLDFNDNVDNNNNNYRKNNENVSSYINNTDKYINKDNNSNETMKEFLNKNNKSYTMNDNDTNMKNEDFIFEGNNNIENKNMSTLKESKKNNIKFYRDYMKVQSEKKKEPVFLQNNNICFQNKNKKTNELKFVKNNKCKNFFFNRKFKIEDAHSIKLNYDNLSNIQKTEDEKIRTLYNKFYRCLFCLDKNIENICLKKYDILNYCKFCKKFLNLLVAHGTKYKGILININFISSDIQNLIFTYKCDKQHLFNISLFHIIHNLWCPHDFCLFQCRDNYSKNYSAEFFRLKELDTMEKQKKLFLQAKIFCLINSYAIPYSNKNMNPEYSNDIDRIIKNANDPWEVLQINKYSKIESHDKTQLMKEAKKNYRMLALKVHPDKNKSHNASLAMNILTNSMKTIMSI